MGKTTTLFAENASNDNRYAKDRNIFFAPPRAPTGKPLGRSFLGAANDPAPAGRGKRAYDTAALWNDVMLKEGRVDADMARRFVDDALSGAFANDPRIADPRARQGLSSLGFETVVNLYESVASESATGMSLYLRELNIALNLDDAFYEDRVVPVSEFFSDASKPFIEQKWAQAKRAGLIDPAEGSFADAMAEALSNPPIWNKEGLERQVNLLQFICDSYSEFVGETSVRVGLFQGQPGLKGFHASKDDASGQQEIIGINVLEIGNFQTCLNILMHERQHASQDRLAEALLDGRIKKGDARYKAARVFAANRANMGYLQPDYQSGPAGYRFQPLEMDAHNAGGIAEYMAFKTYAKKPGLYTERHIRGAVPGNRLSA